MAWMCSIDMFRKGAVVLKIWVSATSWSASNGPFVLPAVVF